MALWSRPTNGRNTLSGRASRTLRVKRALMRCVVYAELWLQNKAREYLFRAE